MAFLNLMYGDRQIPGARLRKSPTAGSPEGQLTRSSAWFEEATIPVRAIVYSNGMSRFRVRELDS